MVKKKDIMIITIFKDRLLKSNINNIEKIKALLWKSTANIKKRADLIFFLSKIETIKMSINDKANPCLT